MEISYYKCPNCDGEFELYVINDTRPYIPYYFNCVFCGAKIGSKFIDR